MPLLSFILHITDFHSPLLRSLAPCIATAFAVQGAVAIPSVLAGSERFFDVSGSATFLAVGALSLYLPALRARAAAYAAGAKLPGLPGLLDLLRGGAGAGADVTAGLLSWRQLIVTGMTAAWAVRLIMLNAVPAAVLASALPTIVATDVLGLSLWLAGFAYEVLADVQKSQWQKEKKLKLHDEDRFPNYFGEITLWTGLATATAGVLSRSPIQQALGLSGGALGILTTTTLSFVSPAFAAFLLLKVSGIPLSEGKYDKRYGDRKDYQEWKKNTPRLIPRLW
ncbi:hypothetical protein TrVGV298_009084 [Trichoderma virens]|nr:hypothetical protein TrVGV298_009084 [Trichoderma virens]